MFRMKTEKELLRRELKKRLSTISQAHKSRLSQEACALFLQNIQLNEFDVLLSYADMKSELSPGLITLRARELHKSVALPKTVPGTHEMNFYFLSDSQPVESQLKKGAFGIREPNGSQETLFDAETYAGKSICAIVPGIAFGKDGGRLGHGNGFYDRYLLRLKKQCDFQGSRLFLAGMCFGFQLQETVPMEKTDVCVDAVICENQFIQLKTVSLRQT